MKNNVERIVHKGRNEIARKTKKHLRFCLAAQSKHGDMPLVIFLSEEDDKDSKIPKRTKARVVAFRSELQKVIVTMVERIETERFDKLEQLLAKRKLPALQLAQSKKIQTAVREILVRYHSVTQAMDAIRHFNGKWLKKIEKAKGSKKTELMLFNAILIYEIMDMVIGLLQNFEMNGKAQLENIHIAIKSELCKQQEYDDQLFKRLEQGDTQIRKNIAANIEERRRIREIVENKWNEIWVRIDGLEENIRQAEKNIDQLKLVRDNAKGQIDILQVMDVSQLIQSNIENLDWLSSVTEIQLAPLTAEDVLIMIGQPSDLP